MNGHRTARVVVGAMVVMAFSLVMPLPATAQTADATAESGAAAAPAEEYLGHVGFHIRGEEVVFVFERALHEFATRGDSGERVAVAGIELHESSVVAVAGEFNSWSAAAWKMERVKPNVYELRKPLEEFQARDSWLFKYVVDGILWVEPPSNASNAVPTGFGNDSFNLVLNVTEPEAGKARELARGRGVCSAPQGDAKAPDSEKAPGSEKAPEGYGIIAPEIELVDSPLLERLNLPEPEFREGWAFKPVDAGGGATPIPVASNPMITSDQQVIGFVSVFVMPPTPEEEAQWESETAEMAPGTGMERITELIAERTATVRAAYVAMYESAPRGPETGVFALEFSEPLSRERREELAVEGPGGAVLTSEWIAAAVWTDDPDRSCMEAVRAHVASVLSE